MEPGAWLDMPGVASGFMVEVRFSRFLLRATEAAWCTERLFLRTVWRTDAPEPCLEGEE